jgi:hypothetical protein
VLGIVSKTNLADAVSRSRTFVPPTKIPPRAPFGPSLVLMAGILFSGIAFVLQKSAAVRRETYGMISWRRVLLAVKHTFSSTVS